MITQVLKHFFFSASEIMEAVRGYHISPLLRLQIQWLYYCAAHRAQSAYHKLIKSNLNFNQEMRSFIIFNLEF